MELTLEIVGYIIAVIVGIVPIINPLSTAPVFISMTADASSQQRKKTATLACLYMFLLLVTFLFIGTAIMQFFGISLISLRIAGGLVIAYMGFRMLFPPEIQTPARDQLEDPRPEDLAFTPLALPMLCGPGSISVVIAMASRAYDAETWTSSLAGLAIISIGIGISALICWAVLWSSSGVVRFFGKSGIDAATKLMGFFLICMGIEIVLSGITALN